MSPRVLIVEDERPVREMLHLLLEDEGFDIAEAADAEEALAAMRVREPELMLVDLRLYALAPAHPLRGEVLGE